MRLALECNENLSKIGYICPLEYIPLSTMSTDIENFPPIDDENGSDEESLTTENNAPQNESDNSLSALPTTQNTEGDSLTLSTEEGAERIHSLTGMYRKWFLDYASYVILERAVPHIDDGLKPVQRRILHAMHLFENGHLHKVAKIVGQTMAFHPHGDASINDALVQLGQKGYLINTQGNWGNILTGDDAAAGRYIEAKLSPLALEVLFDSKLTEWKRSYDGTAAEPVALPARFPLLLAQGAEGIAVGLSSKIYPHNARELMEASIAYLRGDSFVLYPDFPTGGLLDVERYNDGHRGGLLKSRAKIERVDDRLLSITELPYGKTTSSLIESILKANEKGKIKIKHIDDMTAATADIRIQLPAGVSTDKTIDGLYAFTDCEVSLSPNACVIKEGKPLFLGVSDLLRHSVDRTKYYLEEQLRYRLGELTDSLLAASLERIFIEQRIYKDKLFEEAANETEALLHVRRRIEEMKEVVFIRPITQDDLKRLLEIKMARILRFNIDKHEEYMARLTKEADKVRKELDNSTQYTIAYYQRLLKEYGEGWERKTTIARFGTIEAVKVIEATEKLYIDREGGFVGTGLKNAEFVAECSPIDDLIVIFRNGSYFITKVEEKKFVGKGEVVYVNRFQRNDARTIYNLIYRQGKKGSYFIKRCSITGVTRDKTYDITDGTEGSRVVYFTANFNGEAETVRITLKPQPRMRTLVFERDFREIPIRGKSTRGKLVTRAEVQRITLKQRGASTLGGRKVWFDRDVLRLNYNEQGSYVGEFEAEDRLLVLRKDGSVYTTDFSESNHFAPDVVRVEKFDAAKVWSVVYREPTQGFIYLKRFTIEDQSKPMMMQGEENELILYSDVDYPRFALIFGGRDADRMEEVIEAYDFIGVKSIRARGKRMTTRTVANVEEREPLRQKTMDSDEVDEGENDEMDLIETMEEENLSADFSSGRLPLGEEFDE